MLLLLFFFLIIAVLKYYHHYLYHCHQIIVFPVCFLVSLYVRKAETPIMGLVSEMLLLAAIEVLTSLISQISAVSTKFYEVHFLKTIYFKLCRIGMRNLFDML